MVHLARQRGERGRVHHELRAQLLQAKRIELRFLHQSRVHDCPGPDGNVLASRTLQQHLYHLTKLLCVVRVCRKEALSIQRLGMREVRGKAHDALAHRQGWVFEKGQGR